MELRINLGKFARRKLHFRVSRKTRPALARLRYETMAYLQDVLNRAVVADLFAGTGMFGIESLSLGAEKVYFVDKSRNNLKSIEINLSKLGIAPQRYELVNNDVLRFLTRAKKQGLSFDVIFIDPPYTELLKLDMKRQIEYVLELLSRSFDVLNPKSVVVLKLHRKIAFTLPKGAGILEEKRFGLNRVCFLVQTKYVVDEYKHEIIEKTRWQG